MATRTRRTSFVSTARMALRMLRRDWRAGELRVLAIAIVVFPGSGYEPPLGVLNGTRRMRAFAVPEIDSRRWLQVVVPESGTDFQQSP